MGDVVADLLDPGQELLDLVEHGVQVAGQLVELVAAAGNRHPAGQVAGHDLPAGAVDRVDLAVQGCGSSGTPPISDRPITMATPITMDSRIIWDDEQPLANVVSDQQVIPAAQVERPGPGRS